MEGGSQHLNTVEGYLHRFGFHLLGTHPHRTLLSLARRYGPLMLLRAGIRPAVVISSADVAREIMKTHDLIFANRPEAKINRKFLYDLKDVSAAPYSEYWRQLKSICVLQLLSHKRVQSFQCVREEQTAFLMAKIEESCGSSKALNLSKMFGDITNDVVCRAAFGGKYRGGQDGKIKKLRLLLREFFGSL